MKYCRFCGNQLIDGKCECAEYKRENADSKPRRPAPPLLISSFKPNFSSFSAFMSSIRDLSGMSEAASSAADPYEYNVPIVPDCIKAEENEIVVKQYNIAKFRTRLKFMKAEGRLMVTNRRVLFRASGTSLTGNLLQEHQFNLDELGGIEIHKDYKFSLMSMLLSLLLLIGVGSLVAMAQFSMRNMNVVATIACAVLGLCGLVPTFAVYKRFWLKLVGAFVSTMLFMTLIPQGKFFGILTLISAILFLINMVIVCFVPNLVIKIKTKGATGALVIGSQKTLLQRKVGDEYSGFTEVLPWEDTIMAINELGTMIDDLQRQGDYAIEKWSK